MMKEKFTPFTVDASTRDRRVERDSQRSFTDGYARALPASRQHDAQKVDRKQVRTTEGEAMVLNKKTQQVRVPVQRTRRMWIVPQKKRPTKAQKWLKKQRATQVRKFHRGMMLWSQQFDRY